MRWRMKSCRLILLLFVLTAEIFAVHEFVKPTCKKSLELMNECARDVLEHFPDITFSYGYSDEFSFVFKKETKFYQRRASKILSLIVSFFTSVYVSKWKEVFPEKDLRYSPSFRGRVILCASVEVLQAYLAWRQNECHISNQYDTCLWQLIKGGKPEKEAREMLEGSRKQDKNELLYQCFNINYKKSIPQIFRQGTCALRTEVEVSVKNKDDCCPIKRSKRRVTLVHMENIASRRFWNDQLYLLKELGYFSEDVNKTKTEYLKSFQYESRLLLSTWIVIRIDGCHFHRFSKVHKFEKPNDEAALNLMNSCAVGVLEEFNDIVFSYGVSDEYSFVLKKESQLYGRRASEIVSAIVSYFSSMYTMKWKDFFPHKEMMYPPYFDGRAICYPSSQILRDYLAWRQVDCHINNQYNTCFWMLVKSGKTKSAAQSYLKGTQVQEKNELLAQLSGTTDYYNKLPPMFRLGSSVYRNKEEKKILSDKEEEGSLDKLCVKVVIEYCNIIEPSFWEAHSATFSLTGASKYGVPFGNPFSSCFPKEFTSIVHSQHGCFHHLCRQGMSRVARPTCMHVFQENMLKILHDIKMYTNAHTHTIKL
ncbi:tRNA(His) guanylyltransferase 2-like isoform X2 [Henckelia pumila]|uniref:tRNA(His) guanylyltransferase 2-like isoform X2 n=1 Tax=Henckelia pumila TaxID=405737 RepID=UPI003C6DC37C